MVDELEIEATWEVSGESGPEIQGILESEGATIPPETEEAFPLLIIPFAMGAVALARAIIRLWREAKHHGVIIDARGKKLKIKEDPSLPYGTVVVIDGEGQKSTRTDIDDKDELADIIKAARAAG
jgi:hypothetical protein